MIQILFHGFVYVFSIITIIIIIIITIIIIIIIIINTIFSTQWYTAILMSVSYWKPQICFPSGLTNHATLRRLEC